MARQVLVRAGDVDFFLEVADAGGPRTVGMAEALSFDGVRDTVEAIASHLAGAWQKASRTRRVWSSGCR